MTRLLFVGLGLLMLAGCGPSEGMRTIPTPSTSASEAGTPPSDEPATPKSIDMH